MASMTQGIGRCLRDTFGINLHFQDGSSTVSSSATPGTLTAGGEGGGGGGVYPAAPTLNERMAAAGGGGGGPQPAQASPSPVPAELWGPAVSKIIVEVPETGAIGVIYIEPGGGYGARQLGFGGDHDGLDEGAAEYGLIWTDLD